MHGFFAYYKFNCLATHKQKIMPTLSRTQSTPAGNTAYEPRTAAENAQSSDSEGQIVQDQPSTWLRAPAPARFVRKQSKTDIKGQERSSNVTSAVTQIDCASNMPATVEIDADLWNFANHRNSLGRAHTLSIQSKYYLAHRQHVAEELTKADMAPATQVDSCNELWDGFLRVLSV